MNIIYINLDRHLERRTRMEALLRNLPYQRLAAVDGTSLPKRPSPLTQFEIACIESHRQAAQLFLESGAAHVCILEDDVHLGRDFPSYIQDERWIPPEADIIKLETMFQTLRLGSSTPARDRHLHRLYSRHHGTAGYILSRHGAQKLLALTATPQRPLDRILFPDIHGQLITLQLNPALVIQDEVLARHRRAPVQIASSIQPAKVPRPLGGALSREGKRLVQNLRVTLHWLRTGVYSQSTAAKVGFK